MDDRKIIDLLFERSEQGLKELMEKYGHAILHTARNFLKDEQDALECSSDTYMALWNSIPPARPESLPAYIHSTARNLALRRYHANTAQCRNSFYDTALDELSDCLAGRDTAETVVEAQELHEYINRFLAGLKKEDRRLFLRRYWFADSVSDIARMSGLSPKYVSLRLFRTRKKLKEFLVKEGVCL